MVDYSKWQNFYASSSDEEDSEEAYRPDQPDIQNHHRVPENPEETAPEADLLRMLQLKEKGTVDEEILKLKQATVDLRI